MTTTAGEAGTLVPASNMSFPSTQHQPAETTSVGETQQTRSDHHPRNLDAVLHSQGCYETPEGLQQRRQILVDLNTLVRRWVQSEGLNKGVVWGTSNDLGGRIVTYGSYCLGISHQGADIDALCIVPQHTTRLVQFIFDVPSSCLESAPLG